MRRQNFHEYYFVEVIDEAKHDNPILNIIASSS